jgi:hypothetical protein
MSYAEEKRFPNLKANDYLAVTIPATQSAMVFRVKVRVNPESRLNYGAIPLVSGTNLSGYDAATVAVPANGVIPGRAYTGVGSGYAMALTGAYDSSDMWYTNEDYRDRIFYIVAKTTPSWLQLGIEFPKGVQQYRFQRDNVMVGVGTNFGFSRGAIETVQFPDIHQSLRVGNDTNLPVYTGLHYQYNELIIETPRDPLTIYNILAGRVPSYRVDLPVMVQDSSIPINLQKVYGYTGFDMTLLSDPTAAVKDYTDTLTGVII